jgi:hypothetical protein
MFIKTYDEIENSNAILILGHNTMLFNVKMGHLGIINSDGNNGNI